MRWVSVIASLAVVLLTQRAPAQPDPPSEKFHLRADIAWTWSQDGAQIIQLQGPVEIALDHATLSADRAVVWLRADEPAGAHSAQIALIGEAQVRQPNVTRRGPQLFVTALVRGNVQLTANQRLTRPQGESDLYQHALALREAQLTPPRPAPGPRANVPSPATGPAGLAPQPPTPVRMRAGLIETVTDERGKLAVVLSGGVLLIQQRPGNELITLRADRAVAFTDFEKLDELWEGQGPRDLEAQVHSAYLEGDVRVTLTPGAPGAQEQRLEANRVYYEFGTDRAVLTDAVVHSIEPTRQIPVVLRARNVRQLAQGQYDATNVTLTTSGFATPSYSINASRAYVRTVDVPEEGIGRRTTVRAQDATLRVFDVPVFYLPRVGATITDRGLPLRSVGIVNSSRYGFGVTTEWGLFETLGRPAPRDLDVSYRLDYFSDRGPALGLEADYAGGFITDPARDIWNFTGDLRTYWVYDTGFDEFGRGRVDPPRHLRGHVLWEHQHFFPNDWQVQLRAGYTSDPTFLEEWLPSQFENGLPYELSLYVKRQRDIDAATFLVNYQPHKFVTTSDFMQEQFEVEHLPQVGYHRIGDSWAADHLTYSSSSHIAGLRYARSDVDLIEHGFRGRLTPGLPSVGMTGTIGDVVWRAYTRQQVSMPMNTGPLRVVPYVVGIYGGYTDSPDGGAENRVFGGAGVRLLTTFWRVNDTIRWPLLDINRLRHIVEPEVHLFASAQSVERNDVFIYEERYDAINDVAALQLALRQRWQTKRGGPGRWRNVDVLSLNVEANFFANRPDEAQRMPVGFRSLFLPTMPEVSIPRNGINSDVTWRISDTTALLADAQYNLDENELATASVGLAVRRDPRLSYFVGTRYIHELDSNITTVAADYELSRKYTLSLAQSFDFGDNGTVSSSIAVTRRFDRFFGMFRYYYSARDNEQGISINVIPEGLGPGAAGIPAVFGR